jgi:hypothetical protein
MFCPVCGRAMSAPPSPRVAFPMYVCPHDGVVFDQKRDAWHGQPEAGPRLHCPICGGLMEVEPKEPPHRIFFCYQCGTTFDKERTSWYGLGFHTAP